MKRTLLVIIAVVALFSVSVFAFGTPATQAAPSETGTVVAPAPGPAGLADYPNAVISELALPDGTKILSVFVQLEDETAVTAAADTPAITAALDAESSPYKVTDYAYVYYDEVAKGGKKLASKTYEVATATWTNLTVPAGQATTGTGTGTAPAGESFQVGPYTVAITEFKLDKDYSDVALVSVSFSFTNNGEKAISASTAVDVKAFQDGVELESGYSANDPGNNYKEIKPGATINDIMESFVPTGTGPVSLEFTEWIDWEGTTLVEVVYDYPQQ